MVTDTDTAVYLLHVQTRLDQADTMAQHYLAERTLPSLVGVVEDSLLRPHIFTLVTRGASQLFEEVRVQDLRRLFAMCSRVDALPLLKDAWVGFLR